MKRENYGTTEQFVTAFRRHVQITNRQNTPISPYSAALLLTEALRDELPIWVETVRYNFRATIATDMSDNELLMLYEQAIDKGREREKSFIATKPQSMSKGGNFASPTSNPKRHEMREQSPVSYGQSSDGSKRNYNNLDRFERSRKRQMPPRGMNIGQWVERFLNGIQRTNGKCTYCQWGPHDCSKCWYLNPNQRPSGWEASQELWAYHGPQLYAKHQHAPDPAELQTQSKMSRQMDVDDNVYDMTRPLGMMASDLHNPPSPTGGADASHVFNPSQYPSFKPWVNDTAPTYPGFGQSLRIDAADTHDAKQSSLMIEGPQYTTDRTQTLSNTPEFDYIPTVESSNTRLIEYQPQQTICDFVTPLVQAVPPCPDPTRGPDLIESTERIISPSEAPSVASQGSRTSSCKAAIPRWLGDDQAKETSRRHRENRGRKKTKEPTIKVMLTVDIQGSYMTSAADGRLGSFDIRLPNTYKEAVASPQNQKWKRRPFQRWRWPD
jgi:hypothetical protein